MENFANLSHRHPFTLHLTRIVILLLITLSASLPGHAAPVVADGDLTWKNVSFSGHASAAHSILMDSRGIVWVGTNYGLFFYDGVVTHPVEGADLNGAQIYAMVEHGNQIYLGTNHGLLLMDSHTGATRKVDDHLKEIRSMLLVDDTIWVGTLYGVYTVGLRDGITSARTAGLPHRSVYSLLRDTRGIIYAGTFDGLAKWDSVKAEFVPIKSYPANHKSNNLFVNCMMEASDGTFIYVGCEGALYKYHIAPDAWENVPETEGNNIKSLARVDNDHIIIGTDNGIYDAGRDSIRHFRHDSRNAYSLGDNEIWCLMTDDDNNVWAGNERGISISSHSNSIRKIRLSALSHSGEGNEIHCILRDSRGDLWLGGTNGVLRLNNDGETEWYRHDNRTNSVSHKRIRAIMEDSGHDIWLATDGGLNRYDRATDGFDIFSIVDKDGAHGSNWVYAIEENDGKYWIGGFLGGLHRVNRSDFDNHGGVVRSEFALNAGGAPGSESRRLPNDLVNDIEIDSEGKVWVLLFHDEGLHCYNPSTGTMTDYDIRSLTGDYPSGISKDKAGRIWCTFNGGAIVFDASGSSRTVRFADSSEDEAVIAIAPVGDDIWINTYNNLWMIDGTTLKATVIPVPQKEYTAIFDDTANGEVILGGMDEILVIDKNMLNDLNGLKEIYFALVNTGNDGSTIYNLKTDDTLVNLPYGGNLSLIIGSLDYSPEAVHRYMYRLAESPADTVGAWTVLPEGVNTLSFTDLKMGDYNIMVKRVGAVGGALTLPLHVAAPWWLSWWAFLTYILVAALLITAIVVYFKRKNQRHFMEEERRKSLENVEKKLAFLSNISHDLKTPLSMILGPVSIMREKVKDEATRKHLDTVYDNAVRLNNMIHKTIELEHIEADDDTLLILSTFNAVEFCKGVFDTFRENHPQKKFVFHASCGEIYIEADAVKFESVMTNLLSNACKYSDTDATISCGVSRRGDKVEIVVSDDGIGIEEIDQPLVFQRMYRAPSTAKLHEGTGLGLYLIKKYLELMNGRIDLYSRKGQGTSFIVTLPVSEKVTESKSALPADDPGKPKILIVEDNAEISAFICNLLSEEYTVLTAENGRAGLAIASSFFPDLIIADEMMPIMTGLEMCRRLKMIPRLGSTPIIMLTAKTDAMTENESIKSGIDTFMLKPFEPHVLLTRIRQLLKLRTDLRVKARISAITEAKPIEAESVVEKQLSAIAKIIEENISDPDLNVNFVCAKSGLQQKQLYRIIKKYLDTSPVDYIRSVRLQKAAMLLTQKRFTVSEISYMVGFKTPSYFAKCFQQHFGVKPSMYTGDDAGCNASDTSRT